MAELLNVVRINATVALARATYGPGDVATVTDAELLALQSRGLCDVIERNVVPLRRVVRAVVGNEQE